MVEFPNNDEYLWIEKGKSYSNRRKYEEALECYNKAIEINPSNPQAWFEKRHVLYNLGRFEELIELYDKEIENDSSSEIIWRMKANCLKHLDRYEEAIKCYKKIVEINPSNKEALDAIECYKAMRINPSDEETWYMKAECLKRSKRYEEAIKCYNKAIEINPYNENIWRDKGQCLKYLERYEEARKCYDMVIALDPTDEDIFEFDEGNEEIDYSDTMRISQQHYEAIIKDHFITYDDEILEKQSYSKEHFEYGDYEYENDSD